MLHVIATPIGNLGDLSPRALEAFKSASLIACEDTRRTLQLLNHFEIRKPLISCHQHNERARAEEICSLLQEGKEIVYVSDAGMPGISDPGALLVQACLEKNLPCTVVPGASAVLTAAVLSGLPAQPFSFYGFLSRNGKNRQKELETIRSLNHLVILYESPYRIQATLSDLLRVLGDVPCTVLRELTKLHEEAKTGSLSELIPQYENPPKGECVICVLPKGEVPSDSSSSPEDWIRSHNGSFRSVRDLAQAASEACAVSKREAYQIALSISSENK